MLCLRQAIAGRALLACPLPAAAGTLEAALARVSMSTLPRSRSVDQAQLSEDGTREAAPGEATMWPPRSPDAPPDPRMRGDIYEKERQAMPDADAQAHEAIRRASGKAAEAILAGPEAAEAYGSNTQVKFVYQQQPPPDAADADAGVTPARAQRQVADEYARSAGSGSQDKRGGPTDDIPELGGFKGYKETIGAESGLRSPRGEAERTAAERDSSGGAAASTRGSNTSATARASAGSCDWTEDVVGNGISSTIKSGAARFKDSLCKALGTTGDKAGGSGKETPVERERRGDNADA